MRHVYHVDCRCTNSLLFSLSYFFQVLQFLPLFTMKCVIVSSSMRFFYSFHFTSHALLFRPNTFFSTSSSMLNSSFVAFYETCFKSIVTVCITLLVSLLFQVLQFVHLHHFFLSPVFPRNIIFVSFASWCSLSSGVVRGRSDKYLAYKRETKMLE